IDRVKKSRGINELAEQIEPLAQSMATLADEARQVMSQTQQASGSICSANSLMPLDFFTLSIAFMVYCLPVFL
ncbi:IncQ-type mobilization protein MobB, partial [Klebsiella pneumoniae]|uniref:IncQ-type mobilization protein MobB n=1 Tax=Klebsiella pneumoniae TaxID=573 RepID=UPI003CCB1834